MSDHASLAGDAAPAGDPASRTGDHSATLETVGASAADRRRMLARRLADVGVAAADPGAATSRLVQRTAEGFSVDGVPYRLEADARVVLLGAGKASLPIAAALREILGERLDGGVLVVREGEATPLGPVHVLEADHPLPTQRSLQAGEALLEAAQRLSADDVALCCFTGGSSALASVPPHGVEAKEKWDLHQLLLRSGMPIEEINANGAAACEAMQREALQLDRCPVVVSTTLTGESSEAGRVLAGIAAHCVRHRTPWQPPVVLLGCGGETTVTLAHDAPFAAGGPNQEMALAAAREIAGLPIAALFIDTDGSDGGTELAGGLVDGDSAERARELAIDLAGVLRGHHSSGALELLGDELRIAQTGTNVNDLFVIVIDSEETM